MSTFVYIRKKRQGHEIKNKKLVTGTRQYYFHIHVDKQ